MGQADAFDRRELIEPAATRVVPSASGAQLARSAEVSPVAISLPIWTRT